MKKIYRKPVTKAIVLEENLLLGGSQDDPTKVFLRLDLDNSEEYGYAD